MMDSGLTTTSQESSEQGHSGSGDKKLAVSHESSASNTSPMATIQDDDERLLARIGYKQVRKSFLWAS